MRYAVVIEKASGNYSAFGPMESMFRSLPVLANMVRRKVGLCC